MKIAYMHYHLKTGGVTTVLKQQLSAAGGHSEQLVLAGQLPESPLAADTVQIPGLGYSSDLADDIDPIKVAREAIKAIRSRFNGPGDVLHVHNPTLAKNHHFLKILNVLQQEGFNLLLQIHDFAEDGRPLAYFADPYPIDCHYCVINQRDYQTLLNAGLKPEGLHLMENTVSAPKIARLPQRVNPVALYPIRAIRRKNIGEAILLSLFMEPAQSVVITLPPNSAPDIRSYRGWKDFVGDHRLNVAFDRGVNQDFQSLVLSARLLITTSITEGFGFSFLEPWLYDKLLWGRKLDYICRDFESKGISLEHLYNGLYVPVDWIDFGRFKNRWFASISRACTRFGHSLENNHIQRSFDNLSADGVIDFGLLDETSQKKAILQLTASGKNVHRLMRINPCLSAPGAVVNSSELIAGNREAILTGYSPESYRKRLLEIYRNVSTTPVRQQIDKSVLVSSFLNPDQFSLLKWSDYMED
jgi:hypothetical protein